MPVTRRWIALLLCALAPAASAQTPAARPAPATEKVTAAQVKSAIQLLGSVDFPIRMDAARTVRRADSPVALPALLDAVATHADSYVRFKALVLLSGFNDPRISE